MPEVRYVRREGVSIAYQVFGEGPDLLLVPGFVSDLGLTPMIPTPIRVSTSGFLWSRFG